MCVCVSLLWRDRYTDPAVHRLALAKNEERRERRRKRAEARAARGLPPEPAKAPIVDEPLVRGVLWRGGLGRVPLRG